MEILWRFWRDSRGKVIATLVVLWFASLIYQFSLLRFLYPIVAVLVTLALDQLFTRLRSGRDISSLSSVVSGLLIGLILDPQGGALPLIAACTIAALSKQFIGRGSHKHIFNPAAFGMMASSLIVGNHIAWWGASWGLIPAIILLVGMIPILLALRRIFMPITFLIVYVLMLSFSWSFMSALRLTLDGTVVLFAFVMLPEPMTSVISGKWRYGWGLLVGTLVVVQNALRVSWFDPLLMALLGANLIRFFLIRSH